MAPPQWAYQVENFVNEPDEELVCSICRAVFCDPVMCPCDHVFCRVCIGQWIENSRNCPICRKRVSHSSVKQSVPIVKNLILKLQVHCHNRPRGCKAQFSIESSESHLKECEYEFIKCRNKPCKDKLFRKDISKHETSECLHRYVKCKTCGSKILTVGKPEKHNCLRALLERLRAKNAVIRKRNEQIENLKTEIKVLKAVSSGSGFPTRDQNFWQASLTPDEIMINFADANSTSGSSDSDDFSDGSVVIFTSNFADSDDDLEADSFSANNQDSLEYSQNDIPQNASEFRHAESQTVDLSPNNQQDESHPSPSSSAACGNASISVDVPESVFGETEDRPRRQMKRRTSVQKPAKRWLPFTPFSQLSSSDSESDHPSSSNASKPCKFAKKSAESKVASRCNGASATTSHPEAGPSSGSTSAEHSGGAAADSAFDVKKYLPGKTKLSQRLTRQGTAETNSRSSTPLPGSAVFERTLALLEHYNIESDPEWLPEYASHRGNDTTTDSDSSSYNLVDSSCSELSNSESANPDASERCPSSINDIMQWTFDSSSEDDPDWQPPENDSEV